ncbi:unnamed protein product [Caenorhabditis bovis]|uniref:RNase NYN domain-containing protein n=1 Tax=Caenorhabditis bovis TaxID=2654633 RepID=A0A8S1EKA4_9PELO|nr:unnamed protein product [Caenorhabditis bovis]
MHCSSNETDERLPNGKNFIPDVLGLVSLLRYFYKNDFEAFAIISPKYLNSNVTNCKTAINKLVDCSLCIVTHQSNLDDIVALEFAAVTNGVVVTSDNFKYVEKQLQEDDDGEVW